MESCKKKKHSGDSGCAFIAAETLMLLTNGVLVAKHSQNMLNNICLVFLKTNPKW